MPEIMLNDAFGRAIHDTIRSCNVRTVIEIGSWDGLGSTTVLMHALQPLPAKHLVCVEPNPDRHASLQKVVAGKPWITTVCRRSVARDAMTCKTFEAAWTSPYNRLPYTEEVVRKWWNEQCDGAGYLETLTTEEFDAALIDGCEFAGYDDFRLLRDRVRVLMLDDVFFALKCSQANDELRRDPEWECIWSSAFVRNGAAIWVRV